MRGWASVALLGAAVLLSHAPLLRAGYVQDDHLVVEAAREGSPLSGSYWEGITGGDRSLYRPVTLASYAVERRAAGGARPAVSHAVNLVLHTGVAALLLAVGRALGVPAGAALAAAVLFALTPAKSEAVANVVGRAELLAALFTLAAALLAARGTRAAAWSAAACVALAFGSKETGLVALPLVAVTAFVTSASWRTRAGVLLPSVLASTLVVIARTQALEAWFPPQTIPPMDNPLVALSGAAYAGTALGLAARAAHVLAVPWRLANDYSGPTIGVETLAAFRPLLGALLLGLLAAATVGALVRRRAALAVGGALALLSYLVTGNLLTPVGAIFAERFLYLPAAGLALCGAAVLARTGARAKPAVVALALLYGVLAFERSLAWHSDRTIFAATARHNPKSPRAALWLGVLAAERGDQATARRELTRAASLWPDFAAPRFQLGLLEARSGDLPAAAAAFAQASRLEPQWGAPQLNLALALHRRGDRAGAERAARRATLLDPGNPRAWAELGHLRYERGALREAVEPYRRAVALGRGDLAGRLAECEAS